MNIQVYPPDLDTLANWMSNLANWNWGHRDHGYLGWVNGRGQGQADWKKGYRCGCDDKLVERGAIQHGNAGFVKGDLPP